MQKPAVVLAVIVAACGISWAQTTAAPGASPAKMLLAEMPAVDLVKIPLAKVLDQYSQMSGLIVAADWDGLADIGIKQDTSVSLKSGKLPFEKLLDLTLNSIAPKDRPLAWLPAGRVIVVSTQMRILLRDRAIASAGTPSTRPARAARPAGREINLSETPLSLALEYLRDLAGVNMHVNWKALEAVGIKKDTAVTIQAKDITVARALDMVLDQLNPTRDRLSSAYWVVQDGVVEVTTGDLLNRETKTRVFEVGDLLMVVPNFVGPKIDLQSNSNMVNASGNNSSSSGGLFGNSNSTSSSGNNGTGSGQSTEETDMAALRQQQADTLVDVIKKAIGDDMWASNGKGSVKLMRDKLVVTQTPLGFLLLEKSMSK